MRKTVNEVTIDYDDVGHGVPVVLVHGHPFNRSMWAPQTRAFGGSDYRVIAPDLRGYGASTVLAGRTTLTTFARDVAALLDALGVGDIVLGGLSMGGQIVMEFYRLFPARVRGLILADTSPVAESADGRRVRRETADRIVRNGMSGYAEELLPKMLAAETIAAQPAVAAAVLEMMRTTPAEGAAAALRGRAERPDYRETLSRVSVPTAVVVGRYDSYTSADEMRSVHELIPGSSFTVIDGAGHMPNLERPDAFNQAVAEVLAAAVQRLPVNGWPEPAGP